MQTNPQALDVQLILVSKIKANAENPRHVIAQEMVDTLAKSMETAGLQNPVKLTKITEQPEIATPQNTKKPEIPTSATAPIGAPPRDDSNTFDMGQGTRNDSDYVLISGHIRLEAAKKLGWETIPAIIMDLTPDQAELVAILDNQGEDMHWLDWYQAIEKRWNRHPNPTQQKVADELGVSQKTISRAMKLIGFLTPAARNLIYTDGIKVGVSEMAVFRLTDLVGGSEPTPQAQALIEKALEVVISKQMTEPQVAEMVSQANGAQDEQPEIPTSATTPIGAPPRDDSNSTDMGSDPFGEYLKDLPKGIKVKKSKKGYRVTLNLSPAQVGPVVEAARGIMGEKAKSEQPEVATSQIEPIGSAPRNDRNPIGAKTQGAFSPKESDKWQPAPSGFLGKMKQALEDRLKVTPDGVADNLAKDAKQAVNYQIRRGMRNILKNMF